MPRYKLVTSRDVTASYGLVAAGTWLSTIGEHTLYCSRTQPQHASMHKARQVSALGGGYILRLVVAWMAVATSPVAFHIGSVHMQCAHAGYMFTERAVSPHTLRMAQNKDKTRLQRRAKVHCSRKTATTRHDMKDQRCIASVHKSRNAVILNLKSLEGL
eukprot:3998510-Amphidinium_carterae.1